jgi:hypothetical protein
VSDAEVAETEYTAFTSKKGQAITARLIVRRVKTLTGRPAMARTNCSASGAITPCSPTPRSCCSRPGNTSATTLRWNRSSRTGPTAAGSPASGSFPASAAWLALAAIAHNLLRAAGSLASLAYAKARGATLRRDLIDVAARTARHGRGHIPLHLPEEWHREAEWMNLLEAACRPPAAAA